MLEAYVTNLHGRVFGIRNLPHELVAYLFARYSRSELGLRETLTEALADGTVPREPDWDSVLSKCDDPALRQWLKSRNNTPEIAKVMHEKYTVGYGHGSVAEHAVLQFGIEGVSILAAKAIEDARLASYTEKSTRYVQWGADAYVRVSQTVDRASSLLMEGYQEMFEKVSGTYQLSKVEVFDMLRGLLPCSSKTSLGITINAREMEHLLRKLFHHPLPEVRAIGSELLEEGRKLAPTLLGRHITGPSDVYTKQTLQHPTATLEHGVVSYSRLQDAPEKVATATLYPTSYASWSETKEALRELSTHPWNFTCPDRRTESWETLPRAFETVQLHFEVVLDYGAFRDLQRHRMTTINPQPMLPGQGFFIPEFIRQHEDLLAQYLAHCQTAVEIAREVACYNLQSAQYAFPLAQLVRFSWHMNLREAVYITELRSRPQGHESYRKIARQMADIINRDLGKICRISEC